MLLSIIIPVYNEEQLVCELLRKVLDLRPRKFFSVKVADDFF